MHGARCSRCRPKALLGTLRVVLPASAAAPHAPTPTPKARKGPRPLLRSSPGEGPHPNSPPPDAATRHTTYNAAAGARAQSACGPWWCMHQVCSTLRHKRYAEQSAVTIVLEVVSSWRVPRPRVDGPGRHPACRTRSGPALQHAPSCAAARCCKLATSAPTRG